MSEQDPSSDRLALVALGLAMAASATLLLILGGDLRFWSDELTWLTHGDDFAPGTLLTPYNSHLIGIPYVLYELGPRVFGLDYLPFRVAAALGALAVALAVFALARRRVGAPLALAPALVLLFFGAASEVVATPLGIPFSFSIALGLAAFLAVERGTPRTDALAGVLLVCSILSHTFGTIFALGIVVFLIASRAPRVRLLVPTIPLALWGGWYVWAQQFDQGITEASNIAGAPAFVVETAATSLAAIAGVSRHVEGLQSDLVAAIFIPAILALAVLLVLHVRRAGASPWLLAYGATAVVFWFGIAMSESDARQPTTARYLYFGAIMLMLIGVELARGWRPSRRAVWTVAAVASLCVAFNVVRLFLGTEDLTREADEVGAQLAALEVAGDLVPEDFQPGDGIIARAGPLRDLVAEYGSLGMAPAELAEQPEDIRASADFVLVRSLGVLALSSPVAGRDCRSVADPSLFELPPGTSVVAPSAGGQLRLGRFADRPTVVAGLLVPGRASIVALPAGEAGEGWIAAAPGPIEVCRPGTRPPAADEFPRRATGRADRLHLVARRPGRLPVRVALPRLEVGAGGAGGVAAGRGREAGDRGRDRRAGLDADRDLGRRAAPRWPSPRERMTEPQRAIYGEASGRLRRAARQAGGLRGPAPRSPAKVVMALSDRSPSERYLVGRGARTLTLLRPLVPDAINDRISHGVVTGGS